MRELGSVKLVLRVGGEDLHIWGDRGEEERVKCVANILGDAITEGKALEQAHTQTLVASQPCGLCGYNSCVSW